MTKHMLGTTSIRASLLLALATAAYPLSTTAQQASTGGRQPVTPGIAGSAAQARTGTDAAVSGPGSAGGRQPVTPGSCSSPQGSTNAGSVRGACK